MDINGDGLVLEMDGSAKLSSGSMDVGQWLLVNGYPMDTL